MELNEKTHHIIKVALTGGPCAGKTTALVRIIEHFTGLGFQVYTLPEIPTMFIQAGVNYLTKNQDFFYQAERSTLAFQIEMEDQFMQMAALSGRDTLIVCDRGTMDISAYLQPETWQALLDEMGLNTVKLRDSRYDAVLHLVTAANGAEQFYTTANNKARSEGIEQACALDKKIIKAWTGHPHLRVIDNEFDFEQKIHNVLTEISTVLGMPQPVETERKFVVEVVGEIPNAIESEITQTYLVSQPGTEARLRKRGWQGNYVYFHTTKQMVSESERIETERQITPKQYVRGYEEADRGASGEVSARQGSHHLQQHRRVREGCRHQLPAVPARGGGYHRQHRLLQL